MPEEVYLDKAELRVYGELAESDGDWLTLMSEEFRMGMEAVAQNLREKYGVRVEILH